MKTKLKQIVTASLLGTILNNSGFASDVNLHGFIRSSLDVSSSTAKYLDVIDENGDWGGTQAALTYSTNINKEWSLAGQLHYRAIEGELNLDWAFATFQISESSQILFGRQKYPLGLLSETLDIGLTYPWARPPQEMYHTEIESESANLILEGYDGLSAVYTTGDDDWEFIIQPFVGQFNHKEIAANRLRQMSGVKFEASSETMTLQAGYTTSEITVIGGPTDQTKNTSNVGAKIEIDDFITYIEYAKTEVDNSARYDSSAGYIAFAYSFDKLQPSITFAMLEGQKASGAADGDLDQTSVALALAYHYNPSTVFKMQWKNIKPEDPTTAGLIAALPNGETSVDVFTFTMDVVF